MIKQSYYTIYAIFISLLMHQPLLAKLYYVTNLMDRPARAFVYDRQNRVIGIFGTEFAAVEPAIQPGKSGRVEPDNISKIVVLDCVTLESSLTSLNIKETTDGKFTITKNDSMSPDHTLYNKTSENIYFAIRDHADKYVGSFDYPLFPSIGRSFEGRRSQGAMLKYLICTGITTTAQEMINKPVIDGSSGLEGFVIEYNGKVTAVKYKK